MMNRMEVCGSITSMSYDENVDVLMITSDVGDVRYMNTKGCDRKSVGKNGSVSVKFQRTEGSEMALDGVFSVYTNGKLSADDNRDGW